MAGEKFMRKCSRPRAWSKKQSVKSCEMKEGLDNVVIIDVDSDNVIFIDDPESIPQNLVSSSVSRKGKKIEFRGVISIDDDETNNVDSTAPDYVDKPENLDDDECRVVREEASAFKSSNRKQAYSGKNSCRNRYGLYGESESGSSDGNCSDCEVMEGSFGKLHEEWKKAFLKRKSNVCKGKSGLEDQACPSFMNVDTQTGAAGEVGKRNEQCSETAFCSNSSSVNYKTQKFSAFGPTENGHWGTASQNPGKESSFWEFHQNDNFSWPPDLTGSGGSFLKKDGLHFSRATNAEDPSSSSSWWQSYNYVNDGGGTVRMEKHSSQEPSPCSTQEHSAKHCDHIMKPCCTDKEKTVMGEHSNSQEFNRYFVHGKTSFGNEEASFGKSLKSCHAQVNNESFLPNGKGEEVYQATHSFNTSPSRSHHQSSKLEQEKPSSGDSVVAANPQPSKETEVECGVSPSEFEVGHEGKDPFHAQGVIVAHSVQGDIINEREKLKETDEYKRAMEEEWASRQQQLRIQAEEVQRLRKKKRAESMRLLDMERRQKQRLEEIRETQKKDEENMNLKEQLRVEVRKELYKLETTCVDMASLLRGLGIHVGSSFNPLSHEVHAAYKRAVLRFHPDRASKTDIRQQVEAEEKFKLISRMKEKFLLTSCH